MQKDFLDKFYCWNYLRMIIHGCWTWEHFFSPCTNFPAKWRPRQSCRHESPTRWHRHQAWRDIKRGTSAADLFNIKRMQCNFSHASVRMTSSISNAYYAMFQTQQSKSQRTLVTIVEVFLLYADFSNALLKHQKVRKSVQKKWWLIWGMLT